MRTSQIWADLLQKALLLNPSDKQLAGMYALAHIAIVTTPESVAGIATITKDVDGDLVIHMVEGSEQGAVVNGEWGRVVIEEDGWATITGTGLKDPLTSFLA